MHCRDFFNFTLRFSGLPSVGFLNPDPKTFCEIRRVNESGEYVLVHRTPQTRTRTAQFHVQISGQKLCNGDLDRNLKIQLYRYRSSSMKSEHWGEVSLTGNEIKQVQLNQPRSLKYGKSEISMSLISRKMEVEYSFLDFLQHGMALNCVVSIDFTGSNGNPQTPQSLHYISPQNIPNQYEAAILSVGTIIQDRVRKT